MKLHLAALLLVISPTLQAIEITTESSEPSEIATVKLLQALRASHDIKKWEFTDKIHIKKKTIPHSHPVLTLHTRHTNRKQKDLLLSTYIHEQIHWFLDQHETQTRAAIDELKTVFKNVPVGFPEGARDENSTYLHLLVCFLEMEAISTLLSKERVAAVSTFWQKDHYTWIYAQVESNNNAISTIIKKFGLNIE